MCVTLCAVTLALCGQTFQKVETTQSQGLSGYAYLLVVVVLLLTSNALFMDAKLSGQQLAALLSSHIDAARSLLYVQDYSKQVFWLCLELSCAWQVCLVPLVKLCSDMLAGSSTAASHSISM